MTNIKKYLLAFGAYVPQLLFAQVTMALSILQCWFVTILSDNVKIL